MIFKRGPVEHISIFSIILTDLVYITIKNKHNIHLMANDFSHLKI